jgi:hypothetical protein
VRRHRNDAGGVWIVTGLVLGAIVYAGMVTMLVAGFTPVTPLVVIPPVLVALIAGNNLIGGGRSYGRTAARPEGQGQTPRSSGGPDGARPAEPVGSAVAEEPGEPR